MNTQRTIEAIRVMQAFVDGIPIQCAECHKLNWGDSLSPVWNWNNFTYRIKPTLKLRPWNADEVPLGALMRPKHNPHDRVLIGWVSVQADRDSWLDEREHSTDNGVTWKPCGVEEAE
jgi:hypothetical protein